MSWNEFIDIAMKQLNVRRLKLHIPIWFIKHIVRVYEIVVKNLIINSG